jgi:hypothetical protein
LRNLGKDVEMGVIGRGQLQVWRWWWWLEQDELLDTSGVVVVVAAFAEEEVAGRTRDEVTHDDKLVEIEDGHEVISGSAAAQMSDADLLQDDRKQRLPVAARYPSPSLDKLELSNPTSLLSISVCCSNNLSKL